VTGRSRDRRHGIAIRDRRQIEAIAEAGSIIGSLIPRLKEMVGPGVSTLDIDRFCEDFITSFDGAVPAFRGLYGFPGSVCTSVNEEIVHGIPSSRRILREGDIVSVDVGVKLEGWCADSAWTFTVGEVAAPVRRLLATTRDALDAAIRGARAGNHVGDIGAAVMRTVRGTSFKIAENLVGHGIGREVHEDPQVPNTGRPGHGPRLRSGMVVAIEPMIAQTTSRIRTLDDDWTVVSADGGISAHYEHTVAVTPSGPRILTRLEEPMEESYLSQLCNERPAGVAT